MIYSKIAKKCANIIMQNIIADFRILGQEYRKREKSMLKTRRKVLIYLQTKAAREDETTCEEFRMENDCKPASGPNFNSHAGT